MEYNFENLNSVKVIKPLMILLQNLLKKLNKYQNIAHLKTYNAPNKI